MCRRDGAEDHHKDDKHDLHRCWAIQGSTSYDTNAKLYNPLSITYATTQIVACLHDLKLLQTFLNFK